MGVEPGHLVGAVDGVLQHLVQRMAEMEVAVGVRRTVMEHEWRASGRAFPHAVPEVPCLPASEGRRLPLRQVAFHREGGARQEDGIAVIRGGVCRCHSVVHWRGMAEFPHECESGNRRNRVALRGIRRAICTDALHLHRGGDGSEAARSGRLIDRHADAAVAHLEHAATGGADEELRCVEPVMSMVRPTAVEHMRAADEGGETLDLVDQALRGQELQGPIDGRRRCWTARFAQTVKKIIGAGRAGILEDKALVSCAAAQSGAVGVFHKRLRPDQASARSRLRIRQPA